VVAHEQLAEFKHQLTSISVSKAGQQQNKTSVDFSKAQQQQKATSVCLSKDQRSF
jgi:cell shape-determining protein MreC